MTTPADILHRLMALAPHLHPSVSHRAQWEAFLRDVRAADIPSDKETPK